MAKQYSFPHWEITVEDRSSYTATAVETLPLFRPIFFARAQKGPVGVPVWVESYNDACDTFGEGTFDSSTEYFSREALYLNKLFTRQGAFITRLTSPDATYGSLVLELKVQSAEIPQYERDDNGNYVLDDETGDYIPVMDSTGVVQATASGYELTWATRALADGETISSLQPTTYGTGSDQYVIYPMMAVKSTSVGAYSCDQGFKFFVESYDQLNDDAMTDMNSLQHAFGIVEKTYGQDTVSPTYNSSSAQYTNFVVKPDQTYTRFDQAYSFDDIVENYYDGIIPFNHYLYTENFKLIGEMIQAVEDDDTLDDPYMVNLTEPVNINGIPYANVVLSDDSIHLSDSYILYLQGGTDGEISDEAIEALTVQYLNDDIYPELVDQARYPFTAMVDTGVTITTKKAMINYLGKNDAFKVILATQDATTGVYNTKDEDLSMGNSLYATCLLQPESSIKGTECCRAEIYQHAGKLADGTYSGVVPFTLDVMMKKSLYQSTTSVTGIPAKLPNSEITIFKEWNWTAFDSDHKQTSWDSGLNYCQYYDMTGIHWPCMRTVYTSETSVLASATYTDVIVFAKHISRYNWAAHVGAEEIFNTYAAQLALNLSNDINAMINGLYSFEVQVYQTDEDAKLGYRSHVELSITGNPQQRVNIIDIICYRSGYNSEA